MKNILGFTFLFIFTYGCLDSNYPIYTESQTMEIYCSETTINDRSNFILDCIKNANPKSDEEPEDWIKICEEIGESLYCKKIPAIKYWVKSSSSDFWELYDIKFIKDLEEK